MNFSIVSCSDWVLYALRVRFAAWDLQPAAVLLGGFAPTAHLKKGFKVDWWALADYHYYILYYNVFYNY